jgi:hypothetical protein
MLRPMLFIRNGRHHRPQPVTVRLVVVYLTLGAGLGATVAALIMQIVHSETVVRWCA